MKKKKTGMTKRVTAMLLAATVMMTSNMAVFATETSGQVSDSQDAAAAASENQAAENNQTNSQAASEQQGTGTDTAAPAGSGDVTGEVTNNEAPDNGNGQSSTPQADVTADVIVDENNDDVEIKKGDKPYLALGADLSEEQRNTVLALMGINPADLGNYNVTYVNNSEEHQYLDSYVESSKIGSKSWSSVVIIKRDKGNGLNISTKNISYCTVGMYKNALTTAGITDADIIVAGPKPISGTAALVGIFKAYEQMSGEKVQENVVDAALNELVVTGKLEDAIDGLSNEEVEEFIAYIKSVIAEKGLKDEKSINSAIDEACEKYGVTLSQDERQMIVDLLLKITSLGIDLSGLVDYASSLYNSFKNGGASSGILASIGSVFGKIFSSIGNFFKGLFH